jgi:hypothetical protein
MTLKKRYRPYFLSLIIISALVLLISARGELSKDLNPATANISILFDHKIGTKHFSPDSSYTNDFGETFTVNRFKYYISHIQWKNQTTGKTYIVPDSYYLIDESEPVSKQIDLKIPQGTYTSVSFIVGVDSLKNVSGAQDGVLDPINGMFWTWQTGYIMAKLEGTSPVSKLPRKRFEFHIGGFKGAYNVLHPVTIPLKDPVMVKAGKPDSLYISVDINKWFSGKHQLPLSANTAVMTPGKLAQQYAENYFTMFSAGSKR